MGGRRRQTKWEQVGGWWSRTRIEAFVPLLAFASNPVPHEGWDTALWNSLGNERLCVLTTLPGETLAFAADVHERPARPYIPTIFGAPPTHDATRELHARVRKILDLVAGRVRAITARRRGHEEFAWLETIRRRDVVFEMTGRESSDYLGLPWPVAHFEDYQAVLDAIKMSFKVEPTRQATIHWVTGFVVFDHAGEEASDTVAWSLAGLNGCCVPRGTSLRKALPLLRVLFHSHDI